MMWRIKQWFRQALPLALVVALVYGLVSSYREGGFRRGIVPGVTRMLYKVPYFGSRFKHYKHGRSYSRHGRHYRRGHHARKGRGHRHHRRSRRHR